MIWVNISYQVNHWTLIIVACCPYELWYKSKLPDIQINYLKLSASYPLLSIIVDHIWIGADYSNRYHFSMRLFQIWGTHAIYHYWVSFSQCGTEWGNYWLISYDLRLVLNLLKVITLCEENIPASSLLITCTLTCRVLFCMSLVSMFGESMTMFFFLFLTGFPWRPLIFSTKSIASSKSSVLIQAIRQGMDATCWTISWSFQILYNEFKLLK